MSDQRLTGVVLDELRILDPSEYERVQWAAVTLLIEIGWRWSSNGCWVRRVPAHWVFEDAAREVFGDMGNPISAHRLNSDRTVAVATDYFWNEDMTTCPTGAKVQLLGAGGVASYGTYNGRDPFWVAWAPVPKRRPK